MDDNIKKTVYFAHPMSHYDSDFEWECIEIILTMLTPVGEDPTEGHINIMNPNQEWLSNLFLARRDSGDENAFEIFREIARACDITVGVTFLDGFIGAGVWEELLTGLKNFRETYLITVNNGIKMFIPFGTEDIDPYNTIVLSRNDTRKRTKQGVL